MKNLRVFETETQYNNETSGFVYPTVSYIKNLQDVRYMDPPPDPYNGHEYVDLGLPSGTKWATMNVGASSVTDGNGSTLCAWGETAQQYNKDYVWEDYTYGVYDSEDTVNQGMTKYNGTDGKVVLDLTDDAANVNWGGGWHMPTQAQIEELLNTNYVTSAWVTKYNNSNTDGTLFTSVVNGNTLFIPTSPYVTHNSYNYSSYSTLWSNTVYDNLRQAYTLRCGKVNGTFSTSLSRSTRYTGYCIRPVVG